MKSWTVGGEERAGLESALGGGGCVGGAEEVGHVSDSGDHMGGGMLH